MNPSSPMTAKCTCRIESCASYQLKIVKCSLCESAPELLEACKAVVSWCASAQSIPDELLDEGNLVKALRKVNAAIKKAEAPMKGEPK